MASEVMTPPISFGCLTQRCEELSGRHSAVKEKTRQLPRQKKAKTGRKRQRTEKGEHCCREVLVGSALSGDEWDGEEWTHPALDHPRSEIINRSARADGRKARRRGLTICV